MPEQLKRKQSLKQYHDLRDANELQAHSQKFFRAEEVLWS